MKIKLPLLLLLTFISYSQTVTKNFNLVVQPKVSLTISDYENNIFSTSNLLEDIVYYDGFGKPIQTILKQRNPDNKDIVSFNEYDEFGSVTKKYFSFYVNQNNLNFVTSAKTLQSQYYQTKFNDLYPYTEVELEKSPLKRSLKVSNGGEVWKINENNDNDRTIKYVHGVNEADEIKDYSISSSGDIVDNTFYSRNELNKVISKNENWIPADGNLNTIHSFTDKGGKSIVNNQYYQENGETKKSSTYYVYNNKNLLSYILTPKTNSHNFVATSTNDGYNYSGVLNWYYTVFTDQVSSGGGAVNASINNGLLSINFSGGFSPTYLKSGPIVYLDNRIPDANFGNITCTPSSNHYNLYIQNGYLCIGINNYPIGVTGFSGTYTLNIDPSISFLTNQQVLDKYAFQYKYDDYNRKIEQKSPGKGWEYNVFDDLDRPILTQDETLRANNLWLFTKYDAFGRVILSGLYQKDITRSQLQDLVDNFIAGNSNNKSNIEKRIVNTTQFGLLDINYTNDAFPNSNIYEVHTLNYFDDYNFTDPEKPNTPTIILNQNVTIYTKGLQTASYVKTIGDNDNTYSKNYSYYDSKARLIYNVKRNHLNGGGTTTQFEYDFRGNILKTIITHAKGSPPLSRPAPLTYYEIERRFEYDHAERLVAQYEIINSQPEEVIAKYEYDELGTLEVKKVGGKTTTNIPLQTIDYTYNIRGWLTKINDPAALGLDLFSFEIKYDNPTATSSPLYNGNISQVQWKSAMSSSQLQTYSYSFDKLNRLIEANYDSNNNNSLNFFEIIRYDVNDNISFLHRSGDVTGQANLQWMDYLTYYYNGNQLTRIKEEGHGNFGFKSVVPSTNVTPQFEYDSDGNLIKDLNKSITSISYNNLNLVEQVVFSSGKVIKFKYDALRNKLSKTVVDGAFETTTYYLDGFQYLGNSLQFFNNAEGYAIHDNGNFLYVYNFTDHLGNNRLSYCDVNNDSYIENSEIQSIIDFYPYGMSHSGEFTNSLVSNYLYKFQGKEFQTEGGIDLYDFGSRLYDPAVGRWFSPDPQNQYNSPYVALGNNPIRFIDPNGEVAFWDDVAVFVIGGIVNVVADAAAGNINSWEDGLVSFGIGGVSGLATYYGGPVVGGIVSGSLTNLRDQYKRNNGFNNFDIGENIGAAAKSGIISTISFGISGAVGNKFNSLFSRSEVLNPTLNQFLATSATTFTTSTIVGTGVAMHEGASFNDALGVGLQQGAVSLVSNTAQFAGDKVRAHYKNKGQATAQQAEVELTPEQKSIYEIQKNIELQESLAKAKQLEVEAPAAKMGTTALRKVGSVLESVDDVMANPNLLKGKSPLQVEGILGKTPGWRIETLGQGSQKGNGWVLRQYNAKGNPTGQQLRWHPGGGHHGPTPYWRVIGPNGDLGGIIR